MQCLTEEKLRALAATEKVYTCVQKTKEMLFVPMGFICVELAQRGLLIYGLRRSLIYKSEKTSERYSSLVGLHGAANKPVEKMTLLANMLELS